MLVCIFNYLGIYQDLTLNNIEKLKYIYEKCESKLLRIYGVYFDRLRDLYNETNYPWWSDPIKYGKISFVPDN